MILREVNSSRGDRSSDGGGEDSRSKTVYKNSLLIKVRIKVGKEEVNLSLVTDNMLWNIENPKESTIKLPELIKKILQGCKI